MKPKRKARPADWPAVEAHVGSVHAAEVQSIFIQKIKSALSQEAFNQLRAVPIDGVDEWARRLHIAFPCVLNEARAIAEYSKRLNDESLSFGTGHESPRPPTEWLATLSALNSRPPDATHLDDVMATVASDRVLKEQELAIAQGVRASARARIKDEKPPDGVWREDPFRESRRQFNTLAIPKIRAGLLQLERVGAPVGADPLRESEAHFLYRARNHWRARVQEAMQLGYHRVCSWPDMEQHIDWTIRNLVGTERIADIAKSCRPKRSRQAVSRAVNRVVALLNSV